MTTFPVELTALIRKYDLDDKVPAEILSDFLVKVLHLFRSSFNKLNDYEFPRNSG